MTEVMRIDPLDIDFSLIRKAARIINSGGLIVFPTETVYGLGASVFHSQAVARIFEVKERAADKPLAVCISHLDQLEQIVSVVPREAEVLIDSFLPGPLTLVLSKKATVSAQVTADLNSIGVRYPDNKIALALISQAAVPIATTSANISGKPSPTTAQEVLAWLPDQVDLVIDGGSTKLKVPSTIVDFTSPDYRLVREGALLEEELNEVLSREGFSSLRT